MQTPNNFWRTGLIMLAIVVGGLSLLPYLMSDGARESRPDAPFDNSEFLEVAGVELHYREYPARPPAGESARGPLMLVHGMAGSSFSWRKVAEPLAEAGYDVFLVDLPPFGYSDPRIPGRDAPADDELLWGLVDALGRDGEAWQLVGHSMGTGTVARMARHPDRSLRRLVMVSGTPEVGADGGQGLGGVIMRYPPVQRWLSVIGSRRLLNEEGMERALASAYGEEVDAEVVQAYLEPLRIEGKPDAVIGFLHQGRARVSPEDLSGQTLGHTLGLIWGGRDEWVSLSSGRRLADATGAPLEIIDEAGHNPMETHPEAFLAHLKALLAD